MSFTLHSSTTPSLLLSDALNLDHILQLSPPYSMKKEQRPTPNPNPSPSIKDCPRPWALSVAALELGVLVFALEVDEVVIDVAVIIVAEATAAAVLSGSGETEIERVVAFTSVLLALPGSAWMVTVSVHSDVGPQPLSPNNPAPLKLTQEAGTEKVRVTTSSLVRKIGVSLDRKTEGLFEGFW